MKKVLLVIGFLVLIYIIFIFVVTKRFNSNTQIEPLILLSQDKINIDSTENMIKKKYFGLGYTIEYEFLINKTANDEAQTDVISGKLILFDKFLLSAWIQ